MNIFHIIKCSSHKHDFNCIGTCYRESSYLFNVTTVKHLSHSFQNSCLFLCSLLLIVANFIVILAYFTLFLGLIPRKSIAKSEDMKKSEVFKMCHKLFFWKLLPICCSHQQFIIVLCPHILNNRVLAVSSLCQLSHYKMTLHFCFHLFL